MKTHRKHLAAQRLVLFVSLLALTLVPFRNARMQGPQGGVPKVQHSCTCDNIGACAGGKQPPKKDPPPGDPKREPTKYTPMVGIPHDPNNPYIKDKDVKGFDDHSGTAPDTNADNAAGRQGAGTYSQQRRNVYNKLQYAREQNKAGNLTNEALEKEITGFKEELETISEKERNEHQDELKDQLAGQTADIAGRVNTQNTTKTEAVMEKIAQADLNQPIGDLIDLVERALTDNMSQGRSEGSYSNDNGGAFGRARDMVRALFDKVVKDCDRKKVSVTDARRVIFLAEKLHIITDDENLAALEKCTSRTIIARATFGDITYEAKRCLPASMKPDRAALMGDWLILITGGMEGSGHAELGSGGSGSWSGNASMKGAALISQTGPVEISSGSAPCTMKLTASMALGTVAGYAVSMPGVSGDLPIKVLDDVCTMK